WPAADLRGASSTPTRRSAPPRDWAGASRFPAAAPAGRTAPARRSRRRHAAPTTASAASSAAHAGARATPARRSPPPRSAPAPSPRAPTATKKQNVARRRSLRLPLPAAQDERHVNLVGLVV